MSFSIIIPVHPFWYVIQSIFMLNCCLIENEFPEKLVYLLSFLCTPIDT